MGFFKKPTLRTRDDKRTRAAELTLRESIYPLCLVTILFFLWVSIASRSIRAEGDKDRKSERLTSILYVKLFRPKYE